MTFSLGYVDRNGGVEFEVIPQVEDHDPVPDWAVIRLMTKVPAKYPPLPLLTTKAEKGDRLFVVHHPGQTEQVLTRKDCTVLDATYSQEYLRHSCAGEEGSSGALLLHDESQRIVGLHSRGDPVVKYVAGKALPDTARLAARIDLIINGSTVLRDLPPPIPPIGLLPPPVPPRRPCVPALVGLGVGLVAGTVGLAAGGAMEAGLKEDLASLSIEERGASRSRANTAYGVGYTALGLGAVFGAGVAKTCPTDGAR